MLYCHTKGFVRQRGGSSLVFVIRKENEDIFIEEISNNVLVKDDLNSDINKELGSKYGYDFNEHNRNIDGGKGEHYYTEGTDDKQLQWNLGYNLGYDEKSMGKDVGAYQPGAFSRGAGYARGKAHKDSGKMHAFESRLSNSKAENFIETNQARKTNTRKYSNKPIPLLIEN